LRELFKILAPTLIGIAVGVSGLINLRIAEVLLWASACSCLIIILTTERFLKQNEIRRGVIIIVSVLILGACSIGANHILKIQVQAIEAKHVEPATPAELAAIIPKPATAAEIAAEVVKIGGIPPASHSVFHSTSPDISLVFTDSPLFTFERKRQISKDIGGFYLYLKNLGFPVEKEVPPIGVSPYNVQMMGGTFPGTTYDRKFYLPNDSLDDPDAIRKVYASYVFRMLFVTFGEGSINNPDFANNETTATLFEVYYASSYINRNLDSSDWKGRPWMEGLWDIRQKKGKDFTDRAMFYTYKTWDPKAIPGDLESKFWTRFLAGVWVIDNNGSSIDAVQSILAQHHLTQ
jgi:hypothetical protein